VAGIAAGAVAALVLSPLVRSMLYEIRPDDPATVAARHFHAADCCAGRKLDSGETRGRRAAHGSVAARVTASNPASRG